MAKFCLTKGSSKFFQNGKGYFLSHYLVIKWTALWSQISKVSVSLFIFFSKKFLNPLLLSLLVLLGSPTHKLTHSTNIHTHILFINFSFFLKKVKKNETELWTVKTMLFFLYTIIVIALAWYTCGVLIYTNKTLPRPLLISFCWIF